MFRNEKFLGFAHPYNLLDISNIRRLIHIKLCRKASIQMDLSKNNNFLTEEAINHIARTEKEGTAFVLFYHGN